MRAGTPQVCLCRSKYASRHHRADKVMVGDLMEQLLVRFGEDWDAQVRRQKSMRQRARDLFLGWTHFSKAHPSKAIFNRPPIG